MPYDTRKPFDPSGIRLGTPALTTRGMTEEHMPQVAAWMDDAVTAALKDDEAAIDAHRRRGPRPAGRLPDARLRDRLTVTGVRRRPG